MISLQIALQTSKVTHIEPGAVVTHDHYAPTCPFCRRDFEAAIKECEDLIAARDRVLASLGHKGPDGPCYCPHCTSDVEALTLHAADYEMRYLALELQVEKLIAERDKQGTMV